jgi:heme exporter protein C
LREGIEDPERRARFGAVYTLVGAISVPITFLSIRYLRTIHPIVIGGTNDAGTGSFQMAPQMLQTMLFAILAFSVIFVTLFWHRIRLGQFAEKIEQLKLQFTR